MRTFYSTDHDTFYPVGGASIIRANNKKEAKELLSKALKTRGLECEDFTLQEIKTKKPIAIILNDGEY